MRYQPAMPAMKEFCLLLLAITTRMVYVNADDCFADMDRCVEELRRLMTSKDSFWFGTDYESRCVENGQRSGSTTCQNPVLGQSVLARFFNTTEVAPGSANTLEMADVVFSAPEGSYYGCGHEHYVPAVYNHRINPLKITELNSWSLNFAPSVTWKPKDESTFYTILAWDVGYLFLHGFYINARGGSVDTATPISPYSGPKNPQTIANLFLFAVIEQVGYVDPATVGMSIGSIVAANEFRFYPTLLLAMMQNTWTAPVAVNLMSMRGDTYSAEWQKKHYILNFCPMMLSQDDAIHTVLSEAKIPVFWSYEKSNGNPRGPLVGEKAPYMHSLTVDLNVEYSSDKLTIESCCVKSTYMETMYRVNPFQQSYPAVTRDEPRVDMTPVYFEWGQRPTDNKYYTLMMVDMTDAAYQRPDQNFNIHWLVTDISGADVSTGNVILPHAGPNPFDRYVSRVYVFLLFEQEQAKLDDFNLYDYVGDQCPDFLVGRCGGKISDIVRDFDLELAGINWFGVEQDAYARKMIYERFMVQPMVNICDGLPGFEEPCPVYEICSTTAHASALVPGLGVVLLVAVSMMSKLL